MRKIPKNVPRAPDFDNVDDLIEWYRKAYRLPRTWRKLKGWAGYDRPSPRYTPKPAPSSGFRFIDLAKDVRAGRYTPKSAPSSKYKVASKRGSYHYPKGYWKQIREDALRWDDKQRRIERGSRMGRMSTNYLKKEIDVLKHLETELKKIEKYSKVNRTPNLLKGALGRASIFLSVLIPTSEIISEEQEMQHLQEYVPPHLDKVRGYSNVDRKVKKRKELRRGGKASWNY